MDFSVEAVTEIAGELLSEGIEAAVTARKEKKKKNQEDKTDVNQEFDH